MCVQNVHRNRGLSAAQLAARPPTRREIQVRPLSLRRPHRLAVQACANRDPGTLSFPLGYCAVSKYRIAVAENAGQVRESCHLLCQKWCFRRRDSHRQKYRVVVHDSAPAGVLGMVARIPKILAFPGSLGVCLRLGTSEATRLCKPGLCAAMAQLAERLLFKAGDCGFKPRLLFQRPGSVC